ncbi:MAG: hypothetical protein K0Q92_3633, partial [Steroidobacteraceae bacterium]|nr:hypothetical protein [Steroidobacteraceae bacterium]
MKKMRSMTYMRTRALRLSALAIAAAASLVGAGCATMGGAGEEAEPTLVDPPPVTSIDMDEQPETQTAAGEESKQQEGEVPLEVAESEQEEEAPPPEVVVQGSRNRHEAIRDLVVEAQTLLREVDLQYVLTGKGRKRLLRGRPVAFALWSEAKQEWTVAHIELPRPPIKWRPGRRPLAFKTVTPGIQARHVKGTGAERLMFAFSNDG